MTEPVKYNYRLDLRPLGSYFFGGELTFGNGKEVNYFARTRQYPQQTTLLGVLRHLGHRCPRIGPAQIGESFTAEPNDGHGKHGFIKAISPLFFGALDGNNQPVNLMKGPLQPQAHTSKSPLPAAGSVKRYLSGATWEKAYEIPTYVAKNWSPSVLFPEQDDMPDIFKTSTRIGITKQLEGAERTDGFYKQEVGHLAPGATFSCLADLDAELALNIDDRQVLPIGGEKALFGVKLTHVGEQTIEALFPPALYHELTAPGLYVAVLLCDAYVDREAYDKLPFAVTETVSFRHLITPPTTRNFARLHRDELPRAAPANTIRQSRRYSLLRRGSLLYANEADTLVKLLDKERWRAIGYNHYHLLSPNDK